MRWPLLLALLPACGAAHAFDVNGVAIGDKEEAITKKFPSAHCQPLEWKSRAADRRCDDGRIAFAGKVEARVTFYLRRGTVEAFDVRFNRRDLDPVMAFLKQRYGAPAAETRDTIERKNKEARELYRVRWEKGKEHAVLVAEGEKARVSLLASRGDFDSEIYQVR